MQYATKLTNISKYDTWFSLTLFYLIYLKQHRTFFETHTHRHDDKTFTIWRIGARSCLSFALGTSPVALFVRLISCMLVDFHEIRSTSYDDHITSMCNVSHFASLSVWQPFTLNVGTAKFTIFDCKSETIGPNIFFKTHFYKISGFWFS